MPLMMLYSTILVVALVALILVCLMPMDAR